MLPKPRTDVAFEWVDGGGVLLSLPDELYFELNESGAVLWQGLGEAETETELCTLLARRYPGVPGWQLADDVEDFLAAIREQGLVVASDPVPRSGVGT